MTVRECGRSAVCDLCQSEWRLCPGEKVEDVVHSKRECAREVGAAAELRRLQALYPGRSVARSALSGKWVVL